MMNGELVLRRYHEVQGLRPLGEVVQPDFGVADAVRVHEVRLRGGQRRDPARGECGARFDIFLVKAFEGPGDGPHVVLLEGEQQVRERLDGLHSPGPGGGLQRPLLVSVVHLGASGGGAVRRTASPNRATSWNT